MSILHILAFAHFRVMLVPHWWTKLSKTLTFEVTVCLDSHVIKWVMVLDLCHCLNTIDDLLSNCLVFLTFRRSRIELSKLVEMTTISKPRWALLQPMVYSISFHKKTTAVVDHLRWAIGMTSTWKCLSCMSYSLAALLMSYDTFSMSAVTCNVIVSHEEVINARAVFI